MTEIQIQDELVARVEGHGNIVVNVSDGSLEDCEWQVVESPRYFESMFVGKDFEAVPHMTSRICGICSASHVNCSLKAVEDAIGVSITDQDTRLRKLALNAEILQSHVLHLGYLALPDLMDSKSVIPLADTHEDEVRTVIRLHKRANEMLETIAGRSVHSQRLIPGGFSKIPSRSELSELRESLEGGFEDLDAVAELLAELADQLPDFERETEYISLTHPDEYALYEGTLYSSDVGKLTNTEYESVVNEYVTDQSTAKFAKHVRDSYFVGALARFNNNYEQLSGRAKTLADQFGLEPVDYNPFNNTVAQLIEVAHLFERSIGIIDDLLERGIEPQTDYNRPDIEPDDGRGIGLLEAPRGLLIHDYRFEDGLCQEANSVIPTNQNHGNIQQDMETMVPEILDLSKQEIEHTLEMLVRAYDPCISCSTHYLDVEFVDEAHH
ncbi:Ni/Fe hydrogenase subunit alpha [Halodesulfurarchaeum sp.]|uniref:Ni/Fe hydrogenase subunit alpha n=1 Tax=Halodesulfurarchaeum sp. TaxID=1980530 RepID=UPI002FC2A3F3